MSEHGSGSGLARACANKNGPAEAGPSCHGCGEGFVLLFGAGSTRLRRLAILDATFVAKVAAFLRTALGFGGIALLVELFLHIASGFFCFAFDAHFHLQDRKSTRLNSST